MCEHDNVAEVMRHGRIDHFGMSPWEVAKLPNEEAFQGRSLMSYFTELPRGNGRLGAAGKAMSACEAAGVLKAGLRLRVDRPRCHPACATTIPSGCGAMATTGRRR